MRADAGPSTVLSPAEQWDARYSHPNHVYGYRPNDFLVEASVMLPSPTRQGGSRVLVLGDGEGRNGVWLAQQGHRVTTVDLSGVAVAKARAWASEKGVELDAHVGDLATWLDTDAAQGPWDGIVIIFCHLPAGLRASIGEALTPRLSPRGVLVMELFTPAQLSMGTGGPTDESLLSTRERVLAEWPNLRLDLRMLDRRVFEGMGHQGLSSVIQVLGHV